MANSGTTSVVTGDIELPGVASAVGWRIVFTLNRVDTDGTQVIIPQQQVAIVQSDGAITISLWRTASGSANAWYDVTAVSPDSQTTVRVGQVNVPDAASANLNTLLDEFMSEGGFNPPFLTQAQAAVDAAEAAVDAAEAAAAEAVISATSSESSATAASGSATAAAASASEAATLVAGIDAQTVELRAQDAQLADGAGWEIPKIGTPLSNFDRTIWAADGSLLRFESTGPHMVPVINGASSAAWTVDGDAVELARGAFQTETVEHRLAAAPVTGRQLPQIYLKRGDAQVTALTGGPRPVELVSADTTTGTATVLRSGRSDPVKWRTTPLSDGATLHLVLIMGQSLAQGFVDTSPAANGVVDRYPLWRDPVDERALMFAPGDGIPRGPRPLQLPPDFAQKDVIVSAAQLAGVAPLTGAAYAGAGKYAQTAAESCAAALLWQHLHPRDVVLAAVVGTGSTPIADFAAGTEHMASAEAIVARVDEIATIMSTGGEPRAWKVWLVWNQGEQDNIDGTSQAAYVAAWTALRDHLSGVVTTAGGTFGGAVIQQTEQRQGGMVGMATLAQAQLVTSGEASFVPHYPMLPGHSGAAHLFPETYLPLGSGTAWAISEIIAGNGPGPYVASGDAVLVNSTTIDVTFTGGQGAMQFDVSTIPDDGQKGVAVSTLGGDVDITALEWTGDAVLRLTLGVGVLIGDAPVVKFGLTGTGTALLPNPAGPRVNIRDSSNWPCPITGQPVSGWVLQHQVAVAAA